MSRSQNKMAPVCRHIRVAQRGESHGAILPLFLSLPASLFIYSTCPFLSLMHLSSSSSHLLYCATAPFTSLFLSRTSLVTSPSHIVLSSQSPGLKLDSPSSPYRNDFPLHCLLGFDPSLVYIYRSPRIRGTQIAKRCPAEDPDRGSPAREGSPTGRSTTSCRSCNRFSMTHDLGATTG